MTTNTATTTPPSSPASSSHTISDFSFASWVSDPRKPTIVFEHPNPLYGEFGFYADAAKYKAAVAAKKIAFSPKEVMRLLLALNAGYLIDGDAEKYLQIKRSFPTATIAEIVGKDGAVNYKIESQNPIEDMHRADMIKELEAQWK